VAELQLPPDYTAAARARRFVRATLESWSLDEVIDDAELLTSELVTNAVLHARSSARVEIEYDGGPVRVSVCDSSPSPPRVRDYGPQAVTGRGMVLVDRIAHRWGVEHGDGGKCVWFEVSPGDELAYG
jgi:anti-sigma regulatory factor (Ser/Thr protein kinase)